MTSTQVPPVLSQQRWENSISMQEIRSQEKYHPLPGINYINNNKMVVDGGGITLIPSSLRVSRQTG